jgi:hypothetical protein
LNPKATKEFEINRLTNFSPRDMLIFSGSYLANHLTLKKLWG